MATFEIPPSCLSTCQERDPLGLSSLDKNLDLGFSVRMRTLNADNTITIRRDSLPRPMPMPTLITLAPRGLTMSDAHKPVQCVQKD